MNARNKAQHRERQIPQIDSAEHNTRNREYKKTKRADDHRGDQKQKQVIDDQRVNAVIFGCV